MIKYLTAILFLLAIGQGPAIAQFKKGTIMAGGGITGAFNTYKQRSGATTTTDYTDNSITFAPQVGYFILDNLAVGAGLGISTETTKYKTSSDKFKNNTLSAGPFVRYYYRHFFAHGQFQFGKNTDQDVGVNGPVETTHTSSWKLGVGYAWLLNEHIAVEPLLGYGSTIDKESSYTDSAPRLSFQVAFQVYLNR